MHDHIITTSEIRDAWAQIQSGGWPLAATYTKHLRDGQAPRWRAAEPMRWTGCTGAQINDRLQNGYHVDGDAPDLTMGQADLTIPSVELVEEDGDLLIDAALNGDDLYMARWEDFEAKRGLTIRADIAFHCGVQNEVMTPYFEWLLRIVDAAERRGIAPDLELTIQIADCFGDGATHQIIIPLVKGGEVIDAVAWRAFLSPGAFRTLGFVAFGIMAQRQRQTLTAGMGYPMSSKWTATHADDVLTIGAHGGASKFPEDQMTDAVDSALSI